MIADRVTSLAPAQRWEDAMISGNGTTGIMVMGRPLDEKIVINHEKLWVVMTRRKPETPDLSATWGEARTMAFEGRHRDAHEHFQQRRKEAVQPLLEAEGTPGAHRLPYDHIHPGLHLHIESDGHGPIENYQRETRLDTGEVCVNWTDSAGAWERRAFVSRTDGVIVVEIRPPAGERVQCQLRFSEAPGKGSDELGTVTIRHTVDEMYFHAAYARTMGRPSPEGYVALARVVRQGGRARAVQNEGINVENGTRVLLLIRTAYLDDAAAVDIEALRCSLEALPREYDKLLAGHAAVHGEMFRRVTLDLGSAKTDTRSTESLIAGALRNGASNELLETLHAVGRYALICGGTGNLPVALSGIWGNTWRPPWDGRYTFDANINLAISGVSQGALPEAIETYCRYIEDSVEDWRYNAGQLFGCRGILPDLCQTWRHGKALMLYPWVGGAGWLVSVLYDHYRYTGDTAFLRDRVLPLMQEVARFYEDFLAGTEDARGRVRFYPSVSPENFPLMADADQVSSVVPNATCDIAICREALANVLEACREFSVVSEETARWEALLDALPDYVVNDDGALAEWAYPGMGDRYNHRHSSHLYPLWPSLEFSPHRTLRLFRAARKAVDKRLEAGLGNKSAHGYMHLGLVAARLRDPELLWQLLDEFSRQRFFNNSMISCHNPGLMIYNLDATFTLPSILTKMLVHSEHGRLDLFPALPWSQLKSGTVRGLRARGGIAVEELHWNVLTRRVVIQLQATTEQRLVLDCTPSLRTVRPAGDTPEDLKLTGADRTEWTLVLPAGRSVRMVCGI